MGWLLLGIAIAVASLVVLAVVLLSVWRRTKTLMKVVGTAGEAIASSTDKLAQLRPATPGTGRPADSGSPVDTRPTPARPAEFGRRRPGGVA